LIFREYKRTTSTDIKDPAGSMIDEFETLSSLFQESQAKTNSHRLKKKRTKTPSKNINSHINAISLGTVIEQKLKSQMQERTVQQDDHQVDRKNSFYNKVQVARSRLAASDTKKVNKKNKSLTPKTTLNLQPEKPFSVFLNLLMSKKSRAIAWQKNIIFELATYSGVHVPVSVYKEMPAPSNKAEFLRYKKGTMRLIEASEQKVSHHLLSTDEKSKLFGSRKNFIIYTQLAYNRLFFITKLEIKK
jgi:hypothetical protein